MAVKVTIKNDVMVQMFKRMRSLNGLSLHIGFQGTDGAAIHPIGKISNATVALYNEFGTIDAPARSFMRTTMFENGKQIASEFAKQSARVVEDKTTAVAAVSNVGKLVAKLMREKMDKAASWATPNAPSTIEKKEHTQPLKGGWPRRAIASGTLRAALSWSVRRGASVLAEGK